MTSQLCEAKAVAAPPSGVVPGAQPPLYKGSVMSRDVIERLRAYRSRNEWGDPVEHTICTEAAEALSDSLPRSQVAEMASISNAEWTERLSASEARNRSLEEALKPFADTGAILDAKPKDAAVWAGQTPAPPITFGHLRRAAQALQGTTEPQGEKR